MIFKILIPFIFLFNIQLFSQNILGEYTLLKYTNGGSDEIMKITYDMDHVESKVCNIQISGKDTLIEFDWDGQNGPQLGLYKTGTVEIKDSLFTIKNIKLIKPEKFIYSYNSKTHTSDTKTLEIRNFKIVEFTNQNLVLKDLDYTDLNRRYYFKKKKVQTARTPH